MRPREDELIDPEIAEQLDAIDATLAGEPVAPRFAELAELALLLSATRPAAMRPEFAGELDRRVEGRFGRGGRAAVEAVGAGGAGGAGGAVGAGGNRPASRGRRLRWGLAPVLGLAATALVLVAVVLVTSGGGSNTEQNLAVHAGAPAPALDAKAAPPSTAVTTTASSSTAKNVLGTADHASGAGGSRGAGVGSRASAPVPQRLSVPAAAPPVQYANGSINGTVSPGPVPNGRKIVQSSMLQLGTPPRRIGTVAQEVFYVVRAVNAIVESSNVSSTGGPGASAQFHLRVPSPELSQALSELSRLRYATVISRTDNSQDVNNPYLSNERAITNARATLSKLRTELTAATTQTQIASLHARIAVENGLLSHAQSSLGSLNRRIDYSSVDVSVQGTTGGGASSGGGGFGLGKAGHDALRVLEVTAGAALIALAAIVPLGLLVALVWWLSVTVQRRRRERALDLA